MLTGTYSRSIDPKNRVSIPSRFRKEISESVVVLKGTGKCLCVCSLKHFSMMEALMEGLALNHSRAIKRLLFASAKEEKIDGQGRMAIPDDLIEAASIEKEVVILGQGLYFEIWDKKTWQEYQSELNKEVKAALQEASLEELPQGFLLKLEKEGVKKGEKK